jgi:hypothetical protein
MLLTMICQLLLPFLLILELYPCHYSMTAAIHFLLYLNFNTALITYLLKIHFLFNLIFKFNFLFFFNFPFIFNLIFVLFVTYIAENMLLIKRFKINILYMEILSLFILAYGRLHGSTRTFSSIFFDVIFTII